MVTGAVPAPDGTRGLKGRLASNVGSTYRVDVYRSPGCAGGNRGGDAKTRLAIEAGVAQGWHKYVGDQGKIMSIERFGASAPAGVLAEKFGFTVEAVVVIGKQMCGEITQKL